MRPLPGGRHDGAGQVDERPASVQHPVRRTRLLVIRNPVAGRRHGSRFDDTVACLHRLGCAITVAETTGPGAARIIARDIRRQDFDGIVIAGGDGTINEAVNGLAGKALPVGVIPLGTANVIALELGLPVQPRALAETIARGPTIPIHIGDVNGHRFVLTAGVGFDAYVVSRVPPWLKRWIGKAAYVAATLWAMIAYPFPPIRLTIDGVPAEAASAVIANGRFYGGSFSCAPQARLGDPLLQVCLFERGGGWNALRYALGLVLGRLHRLPDVKIVPATVVSVEGPEGDPVQGDGDIVARLPARIAVAPEVVHVMCPSVAATTPALSDQGASFDSAATNSASPV